MKDVKKLLKAQSKHILPDEGVKENIKRELGYSDAEQSAAYAHGGTERFGRKGIISLIAAGLALVLCLCIVLPVLLLHRNPSTPGLIGGGTLDSIDSADEFYAYGAASVGSLLSAAQASGQGAEMQKSARTAAGEQSAAMQKSTQGEAAFAPGAGMRSLSLPARTSGGLTDEEQAVADAASGYLALAEGLLADGAIEYTAVELGQEEHGYPYRMTVTVRDLAGGAVQYTMYYDKILTESETDGEETEAEYDIEGVLLIGGEEYPVRGEKETESEEDETELSLQFTAYRPSDTGRKVPYLRMEQESEEETAEGEAEKFYLYTLYDENGAPSETTAVEYEQEEGELELKITVQRGGQKDEFLFWREDGRGDVLSAEANIGGEEYRFTVTIEAGGYRFEFSDGGRPGDDDD